jgi:hypothetical protein
MGGKIAISLEVSIMARFKFVVCPADQVDDLVQYIHENWAKNHIFCKSRDLLDWQHKSKCGKYYNFIIARSTKDNRICGILGFIPTSHFSAGLADYNEVWLAIWKVNDGPRYVGLGIALLNVLTREFSVKSICSIGISEIVRPIYEDLGFTLGRLSQLALMNATIQDFRIASVDKNLYAADLVVHKDYELKIIDQLAAKTALFSSNLYQRSTIKDSTYIVNRYLKHPVFSYRIFGVYYRGNLSAFIVTRVVCHGNRSVMRVVDIQGNIQSITKITKLLHDVVVDENHEYVDIMQFGLPEEDYAKAGFVSTKHNDSLVLPDYFEPFVNRNIDIFFAYKSDINIGNIILFKGDADQDRPNRL